MSFFQDRGMMKRLEACLFTDFPFSWETSREMRYVSPCPAQVLFFPSFLPPSSSFFLLLPSCQKSPPSCLFPSFPSSPRNAQFLPKSALPSFRLPPPKCLSPLFTDVLFALHGSGEQSTVSLPNPNHVPTERWHEWFTMVREGCYLTCVGQGSLLLLPSMLYIERGMPSPDGA